MPEHFADRLLAAIEQKGSPICVGLDPAFDRLGDSIRPAANGAAELEVIGEFCRQVLQIVAPIAAAVKLQSAYFEVYRSEGVGLYFDLVRQAKELGLVVIGDVKRNDIGSTAGAYAAAHLAGQATPDAITVNGYLGADGIRPFLDVAARDGKGVFVLVRTSNDSAGRIQDFADGEGKKFYQHMAEEVIAIDGEELIGKSGYSCLGAVVGATYPAEARQLRQTMPRQIFLVPGYGAQGATAEHCAAAFKADGTGAIVNASRSVIYAHQRSEYKDLDWRGAVEAAAKAFAEDIKNAVSL